MNKEGRNLEEINKKQILNFGSLSDIQSQGPRKLSIGWNEARIKCERCNELMTAKWKDGAWNIGDWKVYLKKSQVKKNDQGYYIVGGIKFYCSSCDAQYNYRERL